MVAYASVLRGTFQRRTGLQAFDPDPHRMAMRQRRDGGKRGRSRAFNRETVNRGGRKNGVHLSSGTASVTDPRNFHRHRDSRITGIIFAATPAEVPVALSCCTGPLVLYGTLPRCLSPNFHGENQTYIGG